MGKISVVVTVVDEEVDVLPRLISSVEKLADEIVVVDSTKNNILPKLSAIVIKHDRADYVELVRNFGVTKAKGEWILVMDPDEEVSKKLANKLKALVKNPSADYYRLPRKNIIFGKWIKYSHWWPDYNIRFFKKGHVIWSEHIHKVPTTTGKGLDLIADEGYSILHYHYESVEQFVERMNRYTSAQAKEIKKFTWSMLITRPAGEFMSRYFKGKGYKDGLHGLALAGLQTFSEFVVVLKVWQRNGFKKEDIKVKKVIKQFKLTEKEMRYWYAEAGILVNRVKRKLRLQ